MAQRRILFLLCVVVILGLSACDDGGPDRRAETKELVGPGLWPVYVMYTTFLGDAVQLKTLDKLDEKVEFDTFETLFENINEDWQEWVKYFIGFTVCVAVGIVAFLVMLITALVLPCCRCCGKCGGKLNPEEGKRARQHRIGCSISLFFFNCILVLGVLCMFFANERLHNELQGNNTVFDSISGSVSEIKPFLSKSVDELNTTVLQELDNTTTVIFNNLKALPKSVLEGFNDETSLLDAFRDLDELSNELDNLNGSLSNTNITIVDLEASNTKLNTTLTDIKANILAELKNCSSTACESAADKTNELTDNIDFASVNVDSAETAIHGAITAKFPEIINDIDSSLSKISETINTTTYSSIENAEEMADNVQDEVVKVITDIDQSVKDLDLSQVDGFMQDAKDKIEEYAIDTIVYWAIIGLASIVCLIIFTNLIGLFHGACCARPKPGAKCSACDTAQASRWLLTSTAFTLMFYWLYILIVMITFALGGVLYTEFCRNIINFNAEDSRAALGVIDRLVNDSFNDINLQVFDTYRQCEQDKTVYTAFKLAENGFDLRDKIDLTEVREAINNIKGLPVSVPAVHIYDDGLGRILKTLDDGVHLDYSGMIKELQKSLTTVNIDELVDDLQDTNLAALNSSIQELKQLQNTDIKEMKQRKSEVIEDLTFTDDVLSDKNFSLSGDNLKYSEHYINNTGSVFASQFVNQTADGVMIQIEALVDKVVTDTEENIARCRPLYQVVTDLVDTVCTSAMMPLNVLWFSLGWCLFFLIPFLILSFKLSNQFKKNIPYTKNLTDAVDFPEEMLLRDRPANKGYDDLQPLDNLAFDPMEEYRRQAAKAQQAPLSPPPYPGAWPGQPSGKPTQPPQPSPWSYGLPHSPLRQKVPVADYGDVDGRDGYLAHLY